MLILKHIKYANISLFLTQQEYVRKTLKNYPIYLSDDLVWCLVVTQSHVREKKKEQNRFIEATDNNKNITLHPPLCIFTVLPVSYTHQPTQHPNATTAKPLPPHPFVHFSHDAAFYHLTLSLVFFTTAITVIIIFV